MGKSWKLAAAAAVALSLSTAPARAANGLGSPVRVITLAPAERKSEAPAPRQLLADRLGPASATSAASTPDDDVARRAVRLASTDAATRQYGAVRVTVYQMADESVAYVLLESTRPAGATRVALGDDSWSDGANALAFRLGNYTALVEGGAAEAREAAADAVVERLGRLPVRVPLVRVLPGEGRVAGTERYAPSFEALKRLRPDLTEDVFRIDAGGANAVLADYEQPGATPLRLLVVDYETPQLAGEAERSVAAYYGALAPDAAAVRSFRREGNYLVEVTGIADRERAAGVLGAVKYDVTIKMLKGDDPVSLQNFTEEARKAALVFVNSFAIVGLCFLCAVACGLVVGAVIFRRRRRASAEVFSDAGGMVHLDLTAGRRRLGPAEAARLLPGGPAD
jgi:hypothetical protein